MRLPRPHSYACCCLHLLVVSITPTTHAARAADPSTGGGSSQEQEGQPPGWPVYGDVPGEAVVMMTKAVVGVDARLKKKLALKSNNVRIDWAESDTNCKHLCEHSNVLCVKGNASPLAC